MFYVVKLLRTAYIGPITFHPASKLVLLKDSLLAMAICFFVLTGIFTVFAVLYPPAAAASRCYAVLPNVRFIHGCPYNTTSFSQRFQNTTMKYFDHFFLSSANCSSATRILVCLSFVPFCDPNHPGLFVLPCRQLCLSVMSACMSLGFHFDDLPWPAKYNCTTLADPPQSCFNFRITAQSNATNTPASSQLAPSHLALIIGVPLCFLCLIAALSIACFKITAAAQD